MAGLLWPDWPDRDTLSNLRYALSNLRRVIGDRTAEPPFLLITRDTLQFNTASDYWLDVAAFTDLTEPALSLAKGLGDLSGLEKAIALYRGGFLEGFSVGDSPAFEEWALFARERLARQMSSVLHRLSATYEQRGEYEQAQSCAWRHVELEPWDEEAHQQLMRTLALSGQRSAALAQYETCRRLLDEELGVEPAKETTRLYEQIRDGKLRAPVSSARAADLGAEPPPFLDEELVEVERPVFVARERELAQLDGFLGLALAGQGRVVFVTGEAGSGKTALIQEFSRRARDAHADLVVASGNCDAHTGIGDPYLPLREILGLLTGDVEARWAAGAMTREHARRLWNSLPLTAQALVEAGPDLIDTFVPGAALVERAVAYAPGGADWLAGLDELVERKATGPVVPSPLQSDLFEQYTRVLRTLARQAPLVLVVDDLQWADLGSISLLFHLGRQLADSRILTVGAYRPEEVALGRQGERHPLEPVVNEFQREFGDIAVNMDQVESRDFVEAFVDSEPNRLGVAYREMLYQQTRGHPLFTIELLRGMQERGDLVQDQAGRWVEAPALDWETMPARVEAVIAERIGRLAQPLRAALQVASVEGEDLTAEVVARVLGTDERKAVQLSAYQEGLTHLTRGLALLMTLPDSPERAEQELALQLALGVAWIGPEGYGPEVKKAYTRARELCQQMGKTSQLCQVVGELAVHYYVRAEHQTARELGEEALSLAQRAKNPLLVARGRTHQGFVTFCLGEYTTAHAHLEQMISFYEPQQHHNPLVFLRGSDLGLTSLSYAACCLWCLGYPDQALSRSQEALALARELGHPFSLADVLCYAGCMFNEMRRDAQALKDNAEELMQLSNEKGLPSWLPTGICSRGKALAMLGQVQEGIAQMREGMAAMESIGVRCYLPGVLRSLAEAQAEAGQPGEGLTTLAEALTLVEKTDERHWEAELYRLKAELLLMQGDDAEAERSLHKAIEVARRQQAKSWELRATVSLCRLLQKQGKQEEARQLLSEIYGWFTEGFDTPDLREAKALLEELS